MILSDYATTGDGLLAALQVLAVLVEERRPASEVMRLFDPLPQVLKNVRYAGALAAGGGAGAARHRGGRGARWPAPAAC